MSKLPLVFDIHKSPGTWPVRAAGCVLAGGRSRRMGTDKALLELGGKTLVAIAVGRFRAFPEVMVSAADPDRYAFAGVRVVPDEKPGMGPLGGFLSALKAAGAPLVCFRPVDAPLVPAGLHMILAANAAAANAAAVVPVFCGRPEPLLACLSKSALPALEEQVRAGILKAAHLFPLLDTVYLPLEAPELISLFGNPEDWLVNANDPDTFSKLGKR
ncbi:MAG: molybdenum cofactor guanylyltransferase [Clostridiales Family XIII bacterium]|nr:molybdenum cofactor guanylyltransferase [Clostridiales Family XIII bacterium]